MSPLMTQNYGRTGLFIVTIVLSTASLAQGDLLDLTLVTAHPRLDPPTTDDQSVVAYLGAKDVDARDDIVFDRTLKTVDSSNLPNFTYTEENDPGVKKLLFNQSDSVDGIGVYHASVTIGDMERRATTIIQLRNASIILEHTTVTAYVGDNVTLRSTTSIADTDSIRWKKNKNGIPEAKKLMEWTISHVNVGDADVYQCFDRTRKNNGEQGIVILHVISCPRGTWGTSCDQPCPVCLNGGTCDPDSGQCACPPGFNGTNCEQVLGRNRFGQDGSHSCDATRDPHSPGCRGKLFCLPDPFGCSCAAGYMGISCTEECPSGKYGANCEQTCHCSGGNCRMDTGECTDGAVCQEGWTGVNCQECISGRFGDNCQGTCHCQSNDSCRQDTGKCVGGTLCEQGWTGVNCQDPLVPTTVSLTYIQPNPEYPTFLTCIVMSDPATPRESITIIATSMDIQPLPVNTSLDGLNRTATFQAEVSLEQAPLDFRCVVHLPQGNIRSESVTVQFAVPPNLAQAPNIQSVTSNSLSITWLAWDGESDGGDGPVIGYKVYHRMQGEEDFTLSFPGLIHDTSATISNLTRDTEYEIAVAPVRPGSGGEGSMSPYRRTRTYCEAPSEVPVLAFREIGLTSITLSWQKLPAEETWGCRPGSTAEIGILYGTGGNNKSMASFPTSTETGTLSPLLECTIYEITGSIVNKDRIVGQLPAATPVRTAPIIPAAVSNFQYSPSSTQIFFTWSVSTTSCPPDYYIIRYSLLQKRACPSPEPNVIHHETIINTTNNEFNLVGLEAYSNYRLVFAAVNDAGEGEAVERTVFTQHKTPPAVTGLRVNTSITDPTSIGFIWDALTCSNTGGVFGYYYARIYERGQTQGSTPLKKYIDYIDQPSVLFDDLQPCTMYEVVLTASINTASPGATHPEYVSGDASRASGLTGLTLTNVRVEASSTRDSSMLVRWSVPAPCSVSYYSLEYQLIDYLACPGDPIPEAPVSTLNVTGSYNILSGLEPFSSYRVSITGIINGAGNTPVVVTGPSSESAPSPLSSVSYTAEAHTLHFTWDALPCEDLHGELYVYEYNLNDNLTRSYVGSSSRTTRATRLTIDDLNACSDYRFQVRVVLQSGHRSDWTTLIARTNISAPGQPHIHDLEPRRDELGTTGLTLSWAAPNDNSKPCQPTAYEIHYRLLQLDMCNDTSEAPKESAGVMPGSTLTFDLPNLRPYSEYSVFVRGSTSAGYGPEDYTQRTTGYAAPTGVPINVQASTVKKRSLTFTWEEPPCGERHGPITGYDLVLYDATSGAEVGRSNVSSASALEASFPDLIPFYNYSVKIRARNYELMGPYGPRVTQQTSEAKQPAAPMAVTVPSSDPESLTIAWQSPNPPEAHIIGYYIVYWETMLQDADSGDRMNVSIPCTSGLCADIDERISHTIIGLNADTNYSIEVQAESQKGISPPSTPTVTEITKEGLPSAPEALTITGTSKTSLTFSWSIPRYPRGRIVEYKIWYRITDKPYDYSFLPEGTFSEWRTGGDVTSLVLDDLLPATLYEAYLVASTKVGPGDPSERVEGYTAPPSVEDLPVPFPPKIRLSSDNLPVISFSEDLGSPYITHVLVSVSIRAPISRRRRRRETSCGCSSTSDQHSYIAGKVSRRSLPMEFTVGDNTTIGGCYNAPLQDGATYGITTGFESNTGDESTCVFGNPTEVVHIKDPESRKGGGGVVPAVVGILFTIVIIALIVVGFLYIRRRRNRHHPLKNGLVRNRRTPPIRGLKDRNQRGSHVQMGRVSTLDRGNTPSVDALCNEEVHTGGNGTIYENFQHDYVDGEHRPIPISQLVQHVAEKKASTTASFKQDYDKITVAQLHPWDVAKKPENKQKNRYINIVAYDHSRVVLTPLGNDPHSDYINASYIDGYNCPRKYIASQGPNTASVKDFWRMVWEHDCDMIVMLTNLVEGEKKKCEKYWPDNKMLYGKITVTMTKEEINVHYTVRTFAVQHLEETREVVQFHYTSWPDMGVPQYTTPLMNFIRTTKQHKADSKGYTIVHCSAGVGRTGTFITLDSMLDQAEAEGVIDVFNFVTAMRQNRVKMVQVSDQYLFIFNALLETFTCGDTSIAQDVYLQRYPSLLTPSPDTGSTILQEQFGRLEMFTIISKETELRGAKSQLNKDKNRYPDKLPTEKSRPYLITEVDDGTNYINASFLPGYTKKDMFIGTQSPLPHTVVDFWRLVFDYKICTVIMLNGQPLEDQSMAQYWPDASQNEVCFGPFTISLINEEHYDELSTRTLEVRSTTSKSRVQTVYQLQLHTWPMTCEISSSAISIIELHRRAMIWNDTNGKESPILVHCKDGEGATGTFCALSSVMERVHVEKLVDVFQACKRLRAIRGGTVASVAQYELIHSVLRLYLDSYDIYENY